MTQIAPTPNTTPLKILSSIQHFVIVHQCVVTNHIIRVGKFRSCLGLTEIKPKFKEKKQE